MALSQELRKALEKTRLTFDEFRAFESGLALLAPEEQEQFLEIVKQDPDLVYPLYINFKAKLHAAQAGEEAWEAAIEQEIAELEEFIAKRKVGNEIA